MKLSCGHKHTNLRAGRCRACEQTRRYTEDPDYREKAKARARAHYYRFLETATAERLDVRRNRRNELERKRYADDPTPHQERIMRSKYGIGLDEYNEKLAGQRGACAICERKNNGARRLAVDHDHDTGAVRGLLCNPCNTVLGLMSDNPLLLLAAANYLKSWTTA